MKGTEDVRALSYVNVEMLPAFCFCVTESFNFFVFNTLGPLRWVSRERLSNFGLGFAFVDIAAHRSPRQPEVQLGENRQWPERKEVRSTFATDSTSL